MVIWLFHIFLSDFENYDWPVLSVFYSALLSLKEPIKKRIKEEYFYLINIMHTWKKFHLET